MAFQHRTHDDRHHIRNDNEAWSDRRSGRTHHLESSVPDHVLPEVQDCGTRFQGYVRIYALYMCIYFLGGRVGGRVAEIIQYSFALPAVI